MLGVALSLPVTAVLSVFPRPIRWNCFDESTFPPGAFLAAGLLLVPILARMPAPVPEVRPAYAGGSILNLVTSVARHFGVSGDHAPFTAALPLEGVDSVVLLVIDGLGHEQLRQALAAGTLPHFARLMEEGQFTTATSVFPSTTMAALTTLHTARAPGEHGYLGLSTWLPEVQQSVNMIFLHDVVDERPLADTAFLGAVPSLYTQLAQRGVACTVVMPAAFEHSVLTRWCCAGATYVGYEFQSAVASLAAEAANGTGPRYVMAYAPFYDTTCHLYGPSSPQAADELAAVDLMLGRLVAALPREGKTLLLVTADHGHRDLALEQLVWPTRDEAFRRLLTAPPAGEERVTYLRVEPSRMEEAKRHLAPFADVLEAEEAWDLGLFGAGGASPFRERTGNLIAVARDGLAVGGSYGSGPSTDLRGLHGGWSEIEMRVPVLALRR